MTDKEIIFSLECCDNGKCSECSFAFRDGCVLKLRTRAYVLINRQQAEIEMLKRENKILSKNADNAFQEGLNEAQNLYAEQVKNEVKAEAIRYFAERLKYRWGGLGYESPDVDFDYFVDKLVDRMLGAENG